MKPDFWGGIKIVFCRFQLGGFAISEIKRGIVFFVVSFVYRVTSGITLIKAWEESVITRNRGSLCEAGISESDLKEFPTPEWENVNFEERKLLGLFG